MLNLNLSLLTLTFFFIFTRLVLLCLFQIFNDLFFCCPRSFPKADAKVLHFFIPTKFFSNYFSKNFYFFCNHPIYQTNIFLYFLLLFCPFFKNQQFLAILLLKFKSYSEARRSISTTNYLKFSDFGGVFYV